MADISGTTPDRDDLDEVMVPTETVHEDHRAHGKIPKHPNDDELERRTEHEREEIRQTEA